MYNLKTEKIAPTLCADKKQTVVSHFELNIKKLCVDKRLGIRQTNIIVFMYQSHGI